MHPCRLICLAGMLAACGQHGGDSRGSASAPPAKNPTGPLVLVSARDPALAAAAKAALEKGGMRVQDAKPFDDAGQGSLFFGSIDSPPPAAAPPGVAARWKREAEQCRPQYEKCPSLKSSPECEELMRCTHSLLMQLREAWLRELGASAWIEVFAGPTEVHEGLGAPGSAFFAKAYGYKPCDVQTRGLRVGAESNMMMVGSDAPLPTTAAEATQLAGELALRIARGEGTTSPRGPLAWMKPANTDDEIRAMLGCK